MKQTTSYLLSISRQRPERQLIYARKPGFKVSVCYTDCLHFKPTHGSLHFYAVVKNRPVVFEALQTSAANGKAILNAIQWYANYVGIPNLELSLEGPLTPLAEWSYF